MKKLLALFVLVLFAGCQSKDSQPANPDPKTEKKPEVAKEPEQKDPAAKEAAQPQEPKNPELKQVEEKPVDNKTVEEKPAEEKPAEEKPAEEKPAEEKPAEPAPYSALDRATFNQMAVRANLPLYWTEDRNQNGAVDPQEIVTLSFYQAAGSWTEGDAFAPAFDAAYKRLLEVKETPISPDATPEETKRLELVIKELDQGKATLVFNDLSGLSEPEKKFLQHMFTVANHIDELYAIQTGAAALRDQLPTTCAASRSLFRRNFGPKCLGPETEKETDCSAIPGAPKPAVDPYPAALQSDPAFCEALEKLPNAQEIFAPFTVARPNQEDPSKIDVISLPQAYPTQMAAIAEELKAAAQIMAPAGEEALAAYLNAAAQSFTDNNWEPADEAWAKMGARNSKWYLRVGPDEVYWEPCSRKAGFHMTLARINNASLEWQDKLNPVQQEMENVFAQLVGEPYAPRTVTFHLPDFIDIVINAGDDRDPFGATIGQSLPNWGAVANEGRGRTVVMTNLYTDPDSKAQRRNQAESLADAATLADYPTDHTPGLLSIILHEAAHNLGPSHEYKVDGKTDDELFGGPMASTLEELKAQTSALWYIDFLLKKGIISPELARQSYVDSFLWALGHISRGMYSDNNKPKPYSQLAAIQVGFLMEAGAISFNADAMAANGTDKGAFALHLDKWPEAVNNLMAVAGKIKAQGDKAKAEELIGKYVDGKIVPMEIIKERLLRYPKASFVYSIKM